MTKAMPLPVRVQEEPAPRPRATNRILWLAGAVLGVLAVWFGSELGLWCAPLVVGVLAGVGTGVRQGRWFAAYGLTALIAVLGWLLPLGVRALDGQPVAAAANTTADLAGLAGAGGIVLAATVLVALLQAVAGTWLGRAVAGVVAILPAARRESPPLTERTTP